MSETELVSSILDALAVEPNVIAFRNNTGVARVHGFHVRYGLGNGSADIIAVVGPHGRFAALEVKLPKEKQKPDQIDWERDVQARGGFYTVVRSIEEAREAIARARKSA